MPSRHYVLVSLIRTLRARLPSLRSVVPSRHLTPIANYGQAIPVANNPQCQYFCADAYSIQERKNSKLVNAASRPAQRVKTAFAIVKAARRKDLWIIKKADICSEKISTETEENSTFKHIVKIIPKQIFTSMLIIFTLI